MTYRARPIVTPEAQAKKVRGEVFLLITVKADGSIADVEVISPLEYMTESVLEALKRCRFRPAAINGRPITVYRVPIRFPVSVEGN
jgi:TonB family protein